ncbi:hypothetical protein [Nocardioides sp. NPDC047086]|uniref:hypothetical protein n=1 Tax=Nocardioides sp. NPDC047086 TaxID=3154810 RepID=UPI0033F41CDF
MIGFSSLGRWRPEALLAAADRLEQGQSVPHFGHLHDVPPVVDALRHAAAQVGTARDRAFELADQIVARGWTFRAAENEVIIQEMVATAVTYERLDHIETLMGIYVDNMATALTDVEVALNELYFVIATARRDPNARVHPGLPRRLRSGRRTCRDRRRDPWSWCWDR